MRHLPTNLAHCDNPDKYSYFVLQFYVYERASQDVVILVGGRVTGYT